MKARKQPLTSEQKKRKAKYLRSLKEKPKDRKIREAQEKIEWAIGFEVSTLQIKLERQAMEEESKRKMMDLEELKRKTMEQDEREPLDLSYLTSFLK